jgi:hypothetical protein
MAKLPSFTLLKAACRLRIVKKEGEGSAMGEFAFRGVTAATEERQLRRIR